MSHYIELTFSIEKDIVLYTEILIAQLNDLGYVMFEEYENGFKAYIPQTQFNPDLLNELETITQNHFITYTQTVIPYQNWNITWEQNFNPVIVGNDIYVHADFHSHKPQFKYNICIQPEMSFGTGHHETTSCVMCLMLTYNFDNQIVCDMGSGTGILAILASKLNAAKIDAVDFDENCVRNGISNIQRNNCDNIEMHLGDAGFLSGKQYEIIIANINKNILLADAHYYAQAISTSGLLFVSGFYAEDLDDIKASFAKHQLTYKESLLKNNWCAAVFQKG